MERFSFLAMLFLVATAFFRAFGIEDDSSIKLLESICRMLLVFEYFKERKRYER